MHTPMPFDSGVLSGLMAGLLLVLFTLVSAWAYSAHRKPRYEAAARLPLEDDDGPPNGEGAA